MTSTYALKVLDLDMNACNGGHMHYQLNKTYHIKGPAILCKNGIHLTYNPHTWQGQRYFIAKTPKVHVTAPGKMVCLTVTLLQELTPQQLQVYYKTEAQPWLAYDETIRATWKTYQKTMSKYLQDIYLENNPEVKS